MRGPQEPRAGPVPGAGLGGDLLPGPSALSRHGGHMLAAARCTSPVDTRQQTFKMAPGASPWAGDTCLPPDGQDARAKLGQGRVWGEEDGDWAAPQLRVGWGWHINRGAPSGHHRGLCRRRGVLVDLAFACFGRASRGQRGIRTPICWPLSLAPHKLSLDVGARRVGRGRGLP